MCDENKTCLKYVYTLSERAQEIKILFYDFYNALNYQQRGVGGVKRPLSATLCLCALLNIFSAGLFRPIL
jgi:hypothetical protein